MKQFYNRRERRRLAKAIGLVNKNESERTRSERVFRSIQAGFQIQQQFQSIVENDQREALTEKYAQATRNLSEGLVLRWTKPELLSPAEVDATGKVTKPAVYSDPQPMWTSPGHGEDSARQIMENNYKVAEKRREELTARRRKQYDKQREIDNAAKALEELRAQRRAERKAKKNQTQTA